MKIVALDGYAANPGDLSWDEMKKLGECVVYDRTAPAEVVERAEGADVLLTNKVVITAEHMAALPQLKYIGVMATGYNIVDTAAAKERGITVTNIPAYSTDSVAQMVFAHLLNIAQQVQHHSEEVHKGRWTNSPDFCFWDTPLIELAGKKMGIVGLQHRHENRTHRHQFRHGGVCLYFQIALPAATRNQENGTGRTVCRMRRRQPALPPHRADP